MTQATAFPQPSLSPVVPEWGHPLVTPDGQTIRVPAFAFQKLRQLGALLGNSNRLSTKTYQLIRPEFDCITEGLGRLLGADLSGPSWVLCTCNDCQRRATESDHTKLPGSNALDDGSTSVLIRENSLPANLHWRLREVLERCLEKEAKNRYGVMHEANSPS